MLAPYIPPTNTNKEGAFIRNAYSRYEKLMIVTQYVKGMIRDTRAYTHRRTHKHTHPHTQSYTRTIEEIASPLASNVGRWLAASSPDVISWRLSQTEHTHPHDRQQAPPLLAQHAGLSLLTVQRARGLEKQPRSNKITNTEIGELWNRALFR